MEKFNKIIYFDKETISNILQELNKGNKTIKSDTMSTIKGSGELEVDTQLKLSVPLIKRISFLFSGKLSASYVKQHDNTTTITSTEISEFERIKSKLDHEENVQIKDIENSSTFFRVAGGYLRMIKGGIDEVDVKEFNNVMNSYEGYDIYKIKDNVYVRFNNSAFVSNYKRNDLLTTKMNLYCVFVGEFKHEEFDFIKQINKMQTLITGLETSSSLADIYPPNEESLMLSASQTDVLDQTDVSDQTNNTSDIIKLYDVVYAAIAVGGGHRDEQ